MISDPYAESGGDWLPGGAVPIDSPGSEGSFTAVPVAKKGGGFDLSAISSGITGILGGVAGLGPGALAAGADVAKAAMGGTAALATSNASPFNNNANISFGSSKIGGQDVGPNSASATASAGDPSRSGAGGFSPQSLSSSPLDFGAGLSNQTITLIAAGGILLLVGVLFLFGRK